MSAEQTRRKLATTPEGRATKRLADESEAAIVASGRARAEVRLGELQGWEANSLADELRARGYSVDFLDDIAPNDDKTTVGVVLTVPSRRQP